MVQRTNYLYAGFRPRATRHLVSAKVPKTMFARARPHDPAQKQALRSASASVPNQDGSGTRCAQTALAEGLDSGLRLRRARRRERCDWAQLWMEETGALGPERK